jgi:hypothetical protein
VSARHGIDELQAHYFQEGSLTALGAEVDAFVRRDLGGWKLESVDLDADVQSFESGGATVRTIAVYSATVTLTRWRAL